MKKMLVLAFGSLSFFGCNNDAEKKTDTAPAVATETKMQDAEFADAKYVEIGKKGIAALSAGDVAGWMNDYADKAVYVWNNGDSLAGKTAIAAYWQKRRKDVIDSISYSMDVWLPVKVNKPQNSAQLPGVWLLGWYKVDAKYKPSGKKMTQWIHTLMHFDATDKIDRAIQFLDRAPINAAMTK